jgi:hypothetical protein
MAGLRDQLTAGLPVPLTVAVKAADPPAPSDTDVGATATPTGTKVTVAPALFVESATLVANTVRFCWLAIIAGA